MLDDALPIWVGDLVDRTLPRVITASLTEWQWRMIRFALERAGESI